MLKKTLTTLSIAALTAAVVELPSAVSANTLDKPVQVAAGCGPCKPKGCSPCKAAKGCGPCKAAKGCSPCKAAKGCGPSKAHKGCGPCKPKK